MKSRLTDFAICGGPPVFASPLAVGRPALPDRIRLLRRIESVLDSGQLTNGGPLVQEFEHRLQDVLRVRNVVVVCNGTTALQIMIAACGLTGEVIVPSFTFIATAHAVRWLGLTPVFADVDPSTHTLDVASVEQCISDQTSGVLGVHLWGNICDLAGLERLTNALGLHLLFDASHAFGCRAEGQFVGSFGRAEAFSFHATKVMHCLEGGAIATNDDELAERCRRMRAFGFTGINEVDGPGINGKLNEFSAAAGLTSLETVGDVIAANHCNADAYGRMLTMVPGLRMAAPTMLSGRNAHYIVVTVEPRQYGLTRDQLLTVLRAEGVFVRSYFSPGCHRSLPYRDRQIHTPVPLPVTSVLTENLIQFPTGPTVTRRDIHVIGELLQEIRTQAGDLSRHLSGDRSVFHHTLDPAVPAPICRPDAA